MRQFGRHHIADDRDYPITGIFSARQRRTWRIGSQVLDQGSEPACVGYSAAHWLMASPVRQYLDPLGLYKLAQYVDEWEGEDYDGTSVRAALKVLAMLGHITEYRMTQDVEVLADAVLEVGPVGMGTIWTAKMNAPDAAGYLIPKGRVLGGHAWLVFAVDRPRERFQMLNSWGATWGDVGRAFVSFAAMEALLAADGEAWIGVEARPAIS